MKVSILTLVVACGAAAVAAQQAPPAQPAQQAVPGTPTVLAAAKPRDPAWAFQVQAGALPAEPPGPKKIPGSTREYTPQQIDDLLNPPDWLPDSHPAPPAIIVKGRKEVLACGSCHLMSGLGHPESADVTGFTAGYIEQTMADFRSGVRVDPAGRMNAFAKAMTDEEIRQAAAWFASLKPVKFVRVVEAATVPKTFVGQGRMRFIDPKQTGTEPIGKRIITLPENQELARLRDPRSGFVAYVPPGSIGRGKTLVETGARGRSIACSTCHGDALKGLGNVPRLAGVHPIYLARQLYLFKSGERNGVDAQLMKKAVARLSDDDILNISAYLGSLSPE